MVGDNELNLFLLLFRTLSSLTFPFSYPIQFPQLETTLDITESITEAVSQRLLRLSIVARRYMQEYFPIEKLFFLLCLTKENNTLFDGAVGYINKIY